MCATYFANLFLRYLTVNITHLSGYSLYIYLALRFLKILKEFQVNR